MNNSKKNINWFKYIFQLTLCCKNKNKDIKYYEDLRENLLAKNVFFRII